MAEFREMIVTNLGTALINKQLAGEKTIVFTSVQIGTGIYTQEELENLEKRIELKSQFEEYELTSKETVSGTSVKMTTTISNENVVIPQNITEIGLYASDGTNEILYSIAIAKEPIKLPVYNGSTAYSVFIELYASITSELEITITDRSDIATTMIAGAVKASTDIEVASDGTMSIGAAIKEKINRSEIGIKQINNRLAGILDEIYPIGSIYMSVVNTNPGILFGGTWETWGTGKVPVGVNEQDDEFNTVEKTGGEKMHTITVSEMPNHGHYYNGSNTVLNAVNQTSSSQHAYFTDEGTQRLDKFDSESYCNTLISHTGNSQAHNNLQPYITCYFWKRVPEENPEVVA